jgi:hypothetical protein
LRWFWFLGSSTMLSGERLNAAKCENSRERDEAERLDLRDRHGVKHSSGE